VSDLEGIMFVKEPQRKIQLMKNLFENNVSFDLVTLRDLGSRYLAQGPEQIQVIGFQRNAVWREDKIEALWDSILSGFPIGSILLARQRHYLKMGKRVAQISRADLSEDTIIDKHGRGFVVVDGQQRLNGIAQGFMSFDSALSHSRLWIDLAEPDDPDQCQFEFFLCTSDNPFGVNGPNGLNREEKRRALASIDKVNADDSELGLMDTYPYKSKLPVPFYEFWQFIEAQLEVGSNLISFNKFAALFPLINWHLSDRVLELITEKFAHLKNRDIDHELFEALKKTVINGKDDQKYQVPVILVPKIAPERLGKLFERVISVEMFPHKQNSSFPLLSYVILISTTMLPTFLTMTN
jgi:hypothetical protein